MPYTDLHVSVYFAKLEGKIQIKGLTLQLLEIPYSPTRIILLVIRRALCSL